MFCQSGLCAAEATTPTAAIGSLARHREGRPEVRDVTGTHRLRTTGGSKVDAWLQEKRGTLQKIRIPAQTGKASAFTKKRCSCMSPYEEYILSPHWSELRKKAFNKANHKCESCGGRSTLHGHHILYRNLTDCTEEDIMALCEKCHSNWHQFHTSSVIKTREYVLGFLAGLNIHKPKIVTPTKIKLLKRPEKLPSYNIWTRRKDSVVKDPNVIHAAQTLLPRPYKLWLRKYFQGKPKKGVLCGYALKAYKQLAKLPRD